MKLFILLALYLPTSNLFAQTTWQKNFVPDKDTVFTLGQYENIVVAASPTALYITTNSGDSWLRTVSLSIDTSERVLCVGVKNTYILVGTTAGLYLSFDTGEHWRQLSHRISKPVSRAAAKPTAASHCGPGCPRSRAANAVARSSGFAATWHSSSASSSGFITQF